MSLDWFRVWPELIRLNLQKRRHARRLVARPHRSATPPAPCQSASDSGRARETRCEACHRFDRARRYRFVCPDLVFVGGDARCARDSAEVRSYWGRATTQLVLPFVAVWLLLTLGFWGTFRLRGLDALPLTDVLLPTRWHEIAEHRRTHFQKIALRAIADRDPATASIALFSAAQSGRGTHESNILLARLATLGGYHSLADELYATTLATTPHRADLALAWHDDLLISRRPRELARLALAQLSRPNTDRELWLRAFFESIRHPGVADQLSAADSAPDYPHPGLRYAVAARVAIDRRDDLDAADRLLAFSGALPGQAARRFLARSWLDLGDIPRAVAAALSTTHPAPPGEIASLVHALLLAEGRSDDARAALRPLLDGPPLRFVVLAALIRNPDRELLREFENKLAPTERDQATLQTALWIAARLAGADDLARSAEDALRKLGHPVPEDARTVDASPVDRHALFTTAILLPLDREILHVLREAR